MNKIAILKYGLAVLLLLWVGAFFGTGGGGKLGTTLTYPAARNFIETYNFLQDVAIDLRNIRNSVPGWISATGTAATATINTTTGPSTSTIAVAGAALGDQVVVGLSINPIGVNVHGYVSSSGVVTYQYSPTLSSSVTITTSTVFVKVIPQASLVAVPALNTLTTTTP